MEVLASLTLSLVLSFIIAVPSAPTDVTPIVDIDSDTVNVTWVFDNSGNNVPLIQFTFIVSEGSTIVFEGNVDADLRIAIIALSTLMPGTRYDVSITAHNLLGMSQAGGNQFTTFGGSSAGELSLFPIGNSHF